MKNHEAWRALTQRRSINSTQELLHGFFNTFALFLAEAATAGSKLAALGSIELKTMSFENKSFCDCGLCRKVSSLLPLNNCETEIIASFSVGEKNKIMYFNYTLQR